MSWNSNRREEISSFLTRSCCSFATVVLFLKILLNQQGLDKPFTGGLGSYKLYVMVCHHVSPRNVVHCRPQSHRPATSCGSQFVSFCSSRDICRWAATTNQAKFWQASFIDLAGIRVPQNPLKSPITAPARLPRIARLNVVTGLLIWSRVTIWRIVWSSFRFVGNDSRGVYRPRTLGVPFWWNWSDQRRYRHNDKMHFSGHRTWTSTAMKGLHHHHRRRYFHIPRADQQRRSVVLPCLWDKRLLISFQNVLPTPIRIVPQHHNTGRVSRTRKQQQQRQLHLRKLLIRAL